MVIPGIVTYVDENNISNVYIVTDIDSYAFAGCAGLTGNLVIPNTIISIGEKAFLECRGFTGDLIIPESVTEIGEHAFENCVGFNGSLTLPNSLSYLGERAFYKCSGFTGDLVIPSSLSVIEYNVFSHCIGFNSVTIPSSVVEIDGFSRCEGLTSVYYLGTIAQWCNIDFGRVTGVVANPLHYAHNLYINNSLITNLVIPDGITEIKPCAFDGAKCLTSLTLPNSIKRIGHAAFASCNNITGPLVLPQSITTIERDVFFGCSGITGSLYIPNTVTTIGNEAFCNCTSFNGELVVPTSVTKIDYGAFYGCNGFSKVQFQSPQCDDLDDPSDILNFGWDERPPFEGCSGKLEIGENMQDIPAYLFKKAAFEEITLNHTVNSIGDEAFADCGSLEIIRCWRNSPPTLGIDVFANVDTDNVVVHVPCGQDAAYRAADGWKDFSHYEMFIATWQLIVESNDPAHCETEVVQLPLCLSGEASVRARPTNGYQFLGWYENDERVSRDTLYSFYHNSPRVLEARVRVNTGLEDVTATEANVYPNPTNGKVKIDAKDLKRIGISNLLGQVIYDGKACGNEFTYDLGGHEAGVYLIRIETTSGIAVKKVCLVR